MLWLIARARNVIFDALDIKTDVLYIIFASFVVNFEGKLVTLSILLGCIRLNASFRGVLLSLMARSVATKRRLTLLILTTAQ